MGSFDEENQRTKVSRYCPFKNSFVVLPRNNMDKEEARHY
jgi:hypothetical protein